MNTRLMIIVGIIIVVATIGVSYSIIIEQFSTESDTGSFSPPVNEDIKRQLWESKTFGEKQIVTIPFGAVVMEHNVSPSEITIREGQSITWSNRDDVPMTLVSNNAKNPWSTGLIPPGEYSTITFNETGIYEYHGKPWISGRIIVTDDNEGLDDGWKGEEHIPEYDYSKLLVGADKNIDIAHHIDFIPINSTKHAFSIKAINLNSDDSITINFGGIHHKFVTIPEFDYTQTFQVNDSFVFYCLPTESGYPSMGVYMYLGIHENDRGQNYAFYHGDAISQNKFECIYPEIIEQSINKFDIQLTPEMLQKYGIHEN